MGIKQLEKEINKIDNSIDSAVNWLIYSGIQNKKAKLKDSVNAWYDPLKQKYSFVYSEINGYFMTMMVFLYRRTNQKKYLECGLKSAKWLVKNAQDKSGGFRCLFLIDKSLKYSFKQNKIYSFDNGVILNGLVSLYKVSKEPFLLKSAKKCADWIVNSCVDQSSLVKPVYDIEDNKFFDSDKDWSTTSGSYHTKISIGLANLFSVTKNKKYLDYAKKICDKSLKFQKTNGRFVSFPYRGGTNAHPHCYSAEGLWVVGKFLNKKEYLLSSKKATKWILSTQNFSGKIARLFLLTSSVYYQRIDAVAQVVRLIMLNSLKKNNNYYLKSKNKLNKLIKILIANQNLKTNNKKIKGAFLWGKNSDGSVVHHSNSWVTFFAIQALYLYRDYITKKKFRFEEFDLV
jgi:rhamnogalacturonyl hydrolase YesR